MKAKIAAPLLALFACAALALAADPPKAAQPATKPSADVGKRAMAMAAAAPAPAWIWGAEPPADGQGVYFRTSFDSGIAEGQRAKSATLFASCDNELEVLLNGKGIGRSSAWENPIAEDVTATIAPGKNWIAIPAKNREGPAGLIFKLHIVRQDGSKLDILSGPDWKATVYDVGSFWAKDFDDSNWKAARPVAKYGDRPWGKLPKREGDGGGQPGEATAAELLTLLPGFKAERLYSVPKETQGSWVAMTLDPKGRLLVCDQYGGMFRVTPPALGAAAATTKVEPVDAKIGFAQGLLFANDSLYVVVNNTKGIENRGSGLYRLSYDAAADKLGEPKLLKGFAGRGGGVADGEHGPHAVRQGPDGKLYVIAGNFTRIPDGLSPASPARNWAEDQLLPRNPDGGGHDPAVWAPAGWIARCDPDGDNWELVVTGLRNAYDFDINRDGEIFAYDSDMEWDTGSPWYRPTRVLLGVSGGEFGWRNGTGKWPDTYPDSLPAVANTGLGSPTGVVFGYGAKFPAKYQQALYCVDWAYGKVYAAHVTPLGAGYRATFETFVAGPAFDGTDIVVGSDGALYLTIGGRRTQSGLYRITYTGTESTEEAKPTAADRSSPEVAARAARRQLEAFHGKRDAAAVDAAWEHIGSTDRYLRFAARVALESQDLALWQEKVLAEKRSAALTNGVVGLVRALTVSSGGKAQDATATNVSLFAPKSHVDPGAKSPVPPAARAMQPKIIAALDGIQLTSLSEEQLLEALRAYALTVIRLGRPDDAAVARLTEKFDRLYPAPSNVANRELAQLLAYFNAPSAPAKTMRLLPEARTQEDQLHYALVLRVSDKGWTPELRRGYFGWINHAEKNYKGGSSYKKFLAKIRDDAAKTMPPAEQEQFKDLLKGGGDGGVAVVKNATPRAFVRNWQMADLSPDINGATGGRDFAKGKAAFDAVQCIQCHRFAGDGGSNGPDLTGLGARFQPTDVLESILLPSKAISDQYQPTELRLKDGDVLIGSVEGEDADKVMLRTNYLAPEPVAVQKADIRVRRPSRVSLMPEGLVDVLSKEEILDLVAYLRSAGNERDKAFEK